MNRLDAQSANPSPAKHIRDAVSSPNKCSSSTVTELQEILFPRTGGAEEKENVNPRRMKAAPALASTRGAKATTSRVRAKTTRAPEVSEEPCSCTPRERLALATDVINAALKSLSTELKPKPRVQGRLSAVKEDAGSRTGHRRSVSTPTSPSKGPLRAAPLQSKTDSKSRPGRQPLRRSSSFSFSAEDQRNPHIVAAAECARLAIAYLRSQETNKSNAKDLPASQIEQGMLALVGKMLSLGLEDLALKDMQILKKRLVAKLCTGQSPQQTQETLSSLIVFEELDLSSPNISLAISYQLQLIRLIASLRRPRALEGLLKHLDLDNPVAPAHVILKLSRTPGASGVPARQLEALAQGILSICPSIAPSKDEEASDTSVYPSAEATFQLQRIAFETRLLWWGLAGHKGSVEAEILNPFCKCLVAFTRRSNMAKSQQYEICKGAFCKLQSSIEKLPASARHSLSPKHTARVSIHQILGTLAQSISRFDEAMEWTSTSSNVEILEQTTTATTYVNLAAITLEKVLNKGWDEQVEVKLVEALDSLNKTRNPTSEEMPTLLTSVITLRRAATKVFLMKDDVKLQRTPLGSLAFRAISSCIRFLMRYTIPLANDQASISSLTQRRERVDAVLKIAKGFVDSATAASKVLIQLEMLQWEELEKCMRYCQTLIDHLKDSKRDGTGSTDVDAELQFPAVKISNTYWGWAVKTKQKNSSSIENVLAAMHRSVDSLVEQSSKEQQAGNLGSKAEKLGELLQSKQSFTEALRMARIATQAYAISSALEEASDMANTMCPRDIWNREELTALRRALGAVHRIGLLSRNGDYYDDTRLSGGPRTLLLEYNLSLLCQNAGSFTKLYPEDRNCVNEVAVTLLSLYTAEEFPIRRRRLLLLLSQVRVEFPYLLSDAIVKIILQHEPFNLEKLGKDAGLAAFSDHLQASFLVRQALQQQPPDLEVIQRILAGWVQYVGGLDDFESLTASVNDVEAWTSLLESISDYLHSQGHERWRVRALSILIKILRLGPPTFSDKLIRQSVALAQQLLRLGYANEARRTLDEASSLLDSDLVKFEGKAQWHIAYAELHTRTGDCIRSATALMKAEKSIKEGNVLEALTRPTTPLSKKVQLYKLVSICCQAHSLLSLERGSPKEALQYAKQAVSLNRLVWSLTENTGRDAHRHGSTSGVESDASNLASSMASMSLSGEKPFTMSLTHASLTGPRFWSLAPLLFEGLSHLAFICEHIGMAQEALYYLEQAHRISDSVGALTWRITNICTQAALVIKCGDIDRGQSLLAQAKPLLDTAVDTTAALVYHQAAATLCRAIGDIDDELAALNAATTILERLTSSVDTALFSSSSVQSTLPSMESPGLTQNAPPANDNQVGLKKSRGRTATSSTVKSQKKTIKKPMVREANTETSTEKNGPSVLSSTLCEILFRKALAFISQGDLANATELLSHPRGMPALVSGQILGQLVNIKEAIAQYISAIENDFVFNSLPESTVSFPSIRNSDLQRKSNLQASLPVRSTVRRAKSAAKSKNKSKQDFMVVLRHAYELVSESQSLAFRCGSSVIITQVSKLASSISILLSAVGSHVPDVSLHPLQAAYYFGHPMNRTTLLERASVMIDANNSSKQSLVAWPSFAQLDDDFSTSPVQFQHQYIDIIPHSWSAVAMTVSEEHDELFLTRYRSGETPFILRLPMGRHQSRDLDEESFTFDSGKHELQEIIELSDFSTHDGRDMASKGAKTEWWNERKALDERLRDLLLNIENIWLGGFRGLFSQHARQAEPLSRFQKSFENILNAHLPSRRGKSSATNKINLDTRILDLFIGLGDPAQTEADFEEPLMDLVYFVVDILQFNGEHNAYDEVDFDAIVVETLDTLRAYYVAVEPESAKSPHIILILDKELHCFPWESLPSFQHLSMSRLPSLAALRERLLTCAVSSTDSTEDRETGHHLTSRGTTILNPSRDLPNTQKLLSPYLHILEGDWIHYTAQEPRENDFEEALRDRDLVLYFGHGGGAQYIRQKRIRKLCVDGSDILEADGTSAEVKAQLKPTCATTWLMGCSSAHITEHGMYDPSGTITSYMTAGAPAVLGMLWDVTDKDCDRFAIRCGDLWGLWKEEAVAMGQKGGKSDRTGTSKNDRLASRNRVVDVKHKRSLDEAVAESRDACYLRYLNGAAPVVYGIPVYLDW